MEELDRFRQENSTSRKGMKAKIGNSWGVYQAYKSLRKHHWYNIGRPLKEGEFYAIVRGVNRLLAEELLKGNEIRLPAGMGRLGLAKYEVGAAFRKEQLVVTYPIDWSETWKLWCKDMEAFENKSLKRYSSRWLYRIKYYKDKATYANKQFYQFRLNSGLRKRLSRNIKKGITDTLYG